MAIGPTDDPERDRLLQFITDTNETFAEGKRGTFWPRNHHRLRRIDGKASRLLDPPEYEDYLLDIMRVTGEVREVSETDLPLLIAAWRRLLPHLDTGPAQSARRHTLLYLFGFDDKGTLADGELTSPRELKQRMKLIGQVNAYTTQPAQRAKKARFAAFASQAPRILQTLRHLGYRHDRRYDDETYDVAS